MNMMYKDREDDIEIAQKVEMQKRIDASESMEAATEEFENFFKNNAEPEQEEEKPKKVEIVYNASNNTYIVDGVPYSKILYDKKEQRETSNRLVEYLNEQYGIDLLANAKNRKSAIKNIDPTILAILNSKRGKTACQNYIESVCNGKEIDKQDLEFDIKYDLNGMNKNDNLSFMDRLGVMQLANKNSKIAEVEKEIAKPKYEKGKKGNFIKRISMAASAVIAGITLAGIAHNGQKTLDSREIKQLNSGVTTKVEDMQINIEEKELKGPNTFKESLEVKEIEETKPQSNYTLGDVVHLGEGCNYYENSMEGGEHNTIDTNNQWRKAGNYMLDGLAVTYKDTEGKWKIAKAVDDNTNGGNYGKLGLNANEYVEKIMQEKGLNQDQVRVMYHINMGTTTGECPTGWIEAPEQGFQVESKYENQYKIQEQNDNIR